MYSLVLIDDEIEKLEIISNRMDWHKHNIKILDLATNGRDGLETLKKNNPDIAIIDIKMPFINGLDVICYAREIGLKTKFIILSGFGDFEYAQKAIDLGVVTYLLKPTKFEEILQSILKVANKIEEERKIQSLIEQHSKLKESINESSNDNSSNVLQQLIINSEFDDDFKNILKSWNFYKNNQYFIVCALSLKYRDEENLKNNLYQALYFLEQPFCNKLKVKYNADSFLLGSYVCIIVGLEKYQLEDFLIDLNSIQKSFDYKNGVSSIIGVSNIYENIFDTHTYYIEALNASEKAKTTIEGIYYDSQKVSNNKTNENKDLSILIKNALDYTHNNFNSNLSLDTVSKHVYISKTYFSELFKAEVGINFIDYLNRYRIERAKEFLSNVKYKVYEVAFLVGYRNEKYFYSIFKKYTGLTAAQFRDTIIIKRNKD